MTFNHDTKETLRTVDSVVSIVLQIAQIVITSYGLYFVMHHSH
jgi:hypothetical protein